jgi:hypothetical protein
MFHDSGCALLSKMMANNNNIGRSMKENFYNISSIITKKKTEAQMQIEISQQ